MTKKIKNRNYLIVTGCILLILLIVFCIYFYLYQASRDYKITLNGNMTSTKGYDSLKITNIRAERRNGNSYLQFTINNETNTDYEGKEACIVFFDEANGIIEKQKIYISEVGAKEIKEYSIVLDKRILKAHNFIISEQ